MANTTEKDKAAEPEITKRRVTMTSVVALPQTPEDIDKGRIKTASYSATDYVRPDFLDAYVADAKTKWQTVTVSEEPDAGPGGYHGQTAVPDHLSHPLAGQTFAATQES